MFNILQGQIGDASALAARAASAADRFGKQINDAIPGQDAADAQRARAAAKRTFRSLEKADLCPGGSLNSAGAAALLRQLTSKGKSAPSCGWAQLAAHLDATEGPLSESDFIALWRKAERAGAPSEAPAAAEAGPTQAAPAAPEPGEVPPEPGVPAAGEPAPTAEELADAESAARAELTCEEAETFACVAFAARDGVRRIGERSQWRTADDEQAERQGVAEAERSGRQALAAACLQGARAAAAAALAAAEAEEGSARGIFEAAEAEARERLQGRCEEQGALWRRRAQECWALCAAEQAGRAERGAEEQGAALLLRAARTEVSEGVRRDGVVALRRRALAALRLAAEEAAEEVRRGELAAAEAATRGTVAAREASAGAAALGSLRMRRAEAAEAAGREEVLAEEEAARAAHVEEARSGRLHAAEAAARRVLRGLAPEESRERGELRGRWEAAACRTRCEASELYARAAHQRGEWSDREALGAAAVRSAASARRAQGERAQRAAHAAAQLFAAEGDERAAVEASERMWRETARSAAEPDRARARDAELARLGALAAVLQGVVEDEADLRRELHREELMRRRQLAREDRDGRRQAEAAAEALAVARQCDEEAERQLRLAEEDATLARAAEFEAQECDQRRIRLEAQLQSEIDTDLQSAEPAARPAPARGTKARSRSKAAAAAAASAAADLQHRAAELTEHFNELRDRGAPDAAVGSPLHYAALRDDALGVRALLSAGASADDAATRLRSTPLAVAAGSGALGAMQVLAAHGCCVSARDAQARTALHAAAAGAGGVGPAAFVADLAASRLRRAEFVAFLDAVDGAGDSALHIAAREGRTAVALLLVQHGADLSLRDAAGRTPADAAASRGHGGTARALQERAAAESRRSPTPTPGDSGSHTVDIADALPGTPTVPGGSPGWAQRVGDGARLLRAHWRYAAPLSLMAVSAVVYGRY